VHNTDGGNGHPSHPNAHFSVQQPKGFSKVIKIEQRLAHAHENDVGIVPALGKEHLTNNLSCRQIARVTFARCAKATSDRATDLRADANSVPLTVRDEHALHRFPIQKLAQIFRRPVAGNLDIHHLQRVDESNFPQLFPKGFGKVSHGVKGQHTLAVNPKGQLSPPIARLPQLFRQIFQLLRGHAKQDQSLHRSPSLRRVDNFRAYQRGRLKTPRCPLPLGSFPTLECLPLPLAFPLWACLLERRG